MLAASRAHLDKARDFEQKDQLEAALGEYKQAERIRPEQPAGDVEGRRAGSDDPRSHRSVAAEAADSADARAGARRVRRADPQPGVARAAQHPLQQREPARHPELHRQSTGINISYDREVAGSPTTVQLDGVTLEQALNQIMTMNQLSYKVVSERSIFVFPDTAPKHAQYDEQVVRTFYLSHADATEVTQILSTIIRLPGIAVQPAIVGQQDGQHDHGPRHELRRADHREDHRAERQAARRDRRRRRDPRSRPVAREELRPQPVGVRARHRVLAGGVAERHDDHHDRPATTTGGRRRPPRGHRPAERREVAAALQPEHDLARRQHGGLLPRRADRHRALPRDRHAHQGHREAAAPRRRGHQADAEARPADSDHLDQLHADCHRRRGRQPAQLVSVQGRRREHRHDADA